MDEISQPRTQEQQVTPGRETQSVVPPSQVEIAWAADCLRKIIENLRQVFFGNEKAITNVLTSFCANGHLLIEDHPGVGKTLLARAFAKSLDIKASRIQYTPDVVPADVTGSVVFSRKYEEFTFRAGPVFTNVLLADEINRGTPRTQSSLLEAMEERAVTVEDTRYDLPRPFFVIATQNPLEVHGTFPLPESQLDRFMMLISIGYPSEEAEDRIICTYAAPQDPLSEVQAVIHGEDVGRLHTLAARIYIDKKVRDYILKIVAEIRSDPRVKMGVSPRATLSLARASQARAMIEGRDSVLPDDVQELAESVLAHRVVPHSHGDAPAEMLQEHLNRVPVPE